LKNNWKLPYGGILAPMAGITDSPYRRIARRHGAGFLYSECISAEGVRRLGDGSLELARFTEEERPIAIQLFGSEPTQFADAAAVIADRFNPDMIDINCGCPVKKFVKNSYGGYLMSNPELIASIVAAVHKSSDLPVSVKLRAGYRSPEETASEAAIAAEEAGASLIAIHGRYVRGSKGSNANWDVIARVKDAVKSVPVIGNGDIFSYSDAHRMIKETGCDRVMIGRWALGRPWIFRFCSKEYSENDSEIELSPSERINILLEHYQLMLDCLPQRKAVQRMRKHIGWYIRGIPGSARIRRELMTIADPELVKAKLLKYRDELIIL